MMKMFREYNTLKRVSLWQHYMSAAQVLKKIKLRRAKLEKYFLINGQ